MPLPKPRLLALRLVMGAVKRQWPMRLLGPFMGPYDPFTPHTRFDPYPAYRELCASYPVYWHRFFRAYLVSRYDDIARVLRDPSMSVDRAQLGDLELLGLSADGEATIRASLLMLDPPDHTRIRALVNKAFTPRIVEALRPRIASIVDRLLDAIDPNDFDLVRDLAYPLPVIVIAELLGVPPEDRDRFKRWSEDLAVVLDPFSTGGVLDDVEHAFLDSKDYFAKIFEERRRAPKDDLVSALVQAEENGARLNEVELLSVCMLLLGAGHETTTGLIGNSVLALLRHPRELRRLIEDPSIAPNAVEELLRFDCPVQMTDRIVTRDFELGGRTIARGEQLVLMLGAGNRDPERFEAPDRLDLARSGARSLAFGHGIHFCVGAALARVEAEIALRSLFARWPSLALARPLHARDYKVSMVLRGLRTLPLKRA